MKQPHRDIRRDTLTANQYVHSQLVESGEYQKSPHFRPENKAKVRSLVQELSTRISLADASMIDFGCGTGFMIDLTKDIFSEVHGVDITQAMMQQIDTSSGNIFLHEAMAEHTPFQDGKFDFATAYSFMDHLYDVRDFLQEVYRVLKKGGIFYSGLNPNRDFILAMDNAEKKAVQKLSPTVEREIKGALHNGAYYADNFGIDAAMLEKAEPGKSEAKGFDASEMYEMARSIGFTGIDIRYEWFLGQAKVMHEESFDAARRIDDYLIQQLPVSSCLYKYLNFIFTK